MTARQDLKIKQRNAKTIRIEIADKGGSPIDPSADQWLFVFKKCADDDDADALIVKATVGLPGGAATQIDFKTLTIPTGGQKIVVDVFMLATDLDPTIIKPGMYWYQIDRIPSDPAKRTTELEGDFEVDATAIKTL